MAPTFEEAVAAAGSATLDALLALEVIQRRMHPPAVAELAAQIAPHRDRLREGLRRLRHAPAPPGLEAFARQLIAAGDAALEACEGVCTATLDTDWVRRIVLALRDVSRALEYLYPLRALPPIGRFFAEPTVSDHLEALEGTPPRDVRTGLLLSEAALKGSGRGGLALYVPERYTASRAWPLIVALHGGVGSGREFVWTWLREARSRGCLVLAPTARGPTWSLVGPDIDGIALAELIEQVCSNYNVDRNRVLLSGISDGATYALQLVARGAWPFTAVAPIAACALPVVAAARTMPDAWKAKRVYLVHGTLDWMFPIEQARLAARELEAAGAKVVWREIEDLSHAYPREENAAILSWLGVPPYAP